MKNLQDILGFQFHDSTLLEQAFIHSSYINEHPQYELEDNERLEFMGDSVLNFIITEEIYSRFAGLSEGRLTEIRSSLNREETLAQIASTLDLGAHLKMSKGEKASQGHQKPGNLANTFEALIGAIYLDRGINQAKSFLINLMEPYLSSIENGYIDTNYKGLLQEYTQLNYKILPSYRLLKTEGPDHEKTFTVQVKLGNKVLAKGTGRSKRSAEMDAARKAYTEISPDNE